MGDCAHPASSKAPGAHIAIHITHVMMQQYIRGARRVDAQSRSNDPAAGVLRFNHIGFKILIQIITNAARPELDRIE